MTPEEITSTITSSFPFLEKEDGGQWPCFYVPGPEWYPLAKSLKEEAQFRFDYLFCLTCIDWKTHLTMVYHLSSTVYRHTIVIKSKLDRESPVIESVSMLWRTAEFHEREAFEMFGVNFLHHPDLRLLILPDGWEGKYPMRKDFEDPVNMIRL